MNRTIIFLFLISISLTFTACSPKQTQSTPITNSTVQSDEEDEFMDEFSDELQVEEKSDPLEGYNRAMTKFNDGFYEYVLYPTAKGYREVTNEDVRSSIGNFFHNLMYPIRLVNNLLQGKFKNSWEETERFVINTTVGFLGFFDVAKTEFKIQPHEEDFGQTLGYWGVGSGPHIVLPFLGPSNLRDSISMYPDAQGNMLSPDNDVEFEPVESYAQYVSLKLVEKINSTAQNPEQYHMLKKDAVDLYPYLRDIYEQYRIQQIKE